jgi:hypothetical protein
MVLKGRLNQKLEERSKITFEFPGGDIRVLPFFENINISESKKANYVKYQPLGRSSPIVSYTGSDAKQIKLDFKITLPLIQEMVSKDLVSLTFSKNSKSDGTITKQDFKVGSKPSDNYNYKVTNADAQAFNNDYLTLVSPPPKVNLGGFVFFDEESPASLNIFNRKIIDVIVYWLNLIRASVVNNSTTVYQGPPIIRITHGVMYQGVPCLCNGYTIDKDDDAGLDNATLLPRIINVSLDLMELRHGNFADYEPNTPIARDNIIGWEAIIKPDSKYSVTMDPLPIKSSEG